jgi:hypothetical protein
LVTFFVEYNFYGFGTREASFETPEGDFHSAHDVRDTKNVLKAGFNVRFGGWAAPVMAKY